MKVKAIVSEFNDVLNRVNDINTMRDLNRLFNIRWREIQNKDARKAAVTFSVGDKVSFTGRWGAVETGKITKINRTTASVRVKSIGSLGYQNWRVAMNLLRSA